MPFCSPTPRINCFVYYLKQILFTIRNHLCQPLKGGLQREVGKVNAASEPESTLRYCMENSQSMFFNWSSNLETQPLCIE